jgi:hypothetical protein
VRVWAKGTNAGPFDGGALTHGWTRAPAKGPAAAHLLFFPGQKELLCLSFFGGEEGEGGNNRKKEGGRSLPRLRAGRRSSSPSPAPPATETPLPLESLWILRLQG